METSPHKVVNEGDCNHSDQLDTMEIDSNTVVQKIETLHENKNMSSDNISTTTATINSYVNKTSLFSAFVGDEEAAAVLISMATQEMNDLSQPLFVSQDDNPMGPGKQQPDGLNDETFEPNLFHVLESLKNSNDPLVIHDDKKMNPQSSSESNTSNYPTQVDEVNEDTHELGMDHLMADVDQAIENEQPAVSNQRKYINRNASISFKDLSNYDDIFCDLLLDTLDLGFKTHKMSLFYDHHGPTKQPYANDQPNKPNVYEKEYETDKALSGNSNSTKYSAISTENDPDSRNCKLIEKHIQPFAEIEQTSIEKDVVSILQEQSETKQTEEATIQEFDNNTIVQSMVDQNPLEGTASNFHHNEKSDVENVEHCADSSVALLHEDVTVLLNTIFDTIFPEKQKSHSPTDVNDEKAKIYATDIPETDTNGLVNPASSIESVASETENLDTTNKKVNTPEIEKPLADNLPTTQQTYVAVVGNVSNENTLTSIEEPVFSFDRSLFKTKLLEVVRTHIMFEAQFDVASQAIFDLLSDPEISHSSFIEFTQSLSETQKRDFFDHCRRYLSMYYHAAGYEITQTFRYSTSAKKEASIIATKHWNQGDQIKFCEGIIASLTPKDEENLKNRDFSIMYSKRKQCMCLFLGPARFVNHDCEPNVKFITNGPNTICFLVLRPIVPGEEITTFYAENYFGEGNRECLCQSCEDNMRGGFAKTHHTELTLRVSKIRKKGFNFGFKNNKPKKNKEPTNIDSDVVTCSTCRKAIDKLEEPLVPPETESVIRNCNRCSRHFNIFGQGWPSRKLRNYRNIQPVKNNEEETNEKQKAVQEEKEPEPIIEGNSPEDENYPHVIFVNPFKKEEPYWWPAIVIPIGECEASIKKSVGITESDGHFFVTYFNAYNQFSYVEKEHTRVFDPEQEPFLSFSKVPEFFEDPSVQDALEYLKTNVFKMPWKTWEAARSLVPGGEVVNIQTQKLEKKEGFCRRCRDLNILCDLNIPSCQNCSWVGAKCTFSENLDFLTSERTLRRPRAPVVEETKSKPAKRVSKSLPLDESAMKQLVETRSPLKNSKNAKSKYDRRKSAPAARDKKKRKLFYDENGNPLEIILETELDISGLKEVALKILMNLPTKYRSRYCLDEFDEDMLDDYAVQPHFDRNNWAFWLDHEYFMQSRCLEDMMKELRENYRVRKCENWKMFFPKLHDRKFLKEYHEEKKANSLLELNKIEEYSDEMEAQKETPSELKDTTVTSEYTVSETISTSDTIIDIEGDRAEKRESSLLDTEKENEEIPSAPLSVTKNNTSKDKPDMEQEQSSSQEFQSTKTKTSTNSTPHSRKEKKSFSITPSRFFSKVNIENGSARRNSQDESPNEFFSKIKENQKSERLDRKIELFPIFSGVTRKAKKRPAAADVNEPTSNKETNDSKSESFTTNLKFEIIGTTAKVPAQFGKKAKLSK